MTAERSKPNARRLFRRLRTQFKQDAGLKEHLTGAERVLIDQASLLALRARQMRDNILTGDKPVSDEDLVRATNACIRAMGALRSTTRIRDTEVEAVAVHGPVSDLDPIEILLREKQEREDAANG